MQAFHALPALVFCIGLFTISFTYWVSTVYYGHQPIWLPTISETGDLPPESCFFSWGLSNLSFLLGILLFVKYQHCKCIFETEEFLTQRSMRYWKSMNKGAVGIHSSEFLLFFHQRLLLPDFSAFALIL